MNFIEARQLAKKNKHKIVFLRKNSKEIVFKCEYCHAEMKRKEEKNATWEGAVLTKTCSKAPKNKEKSPT